MAAAKNPPMKLDITLNASPELTAFLQALLGGGAMQAGGPGPVPEQAPTAPQPAPPAPPAAAMPPVPSQPQPVPQQPVAQQWAPQPGVAAPAGYPPVQAPMAPQPGTPAAVPTTERSYTAEELAYAAAAILDRGPEMQQHLQALLQQFGVEQVTALPPAQYGAMATALRGLGANI